MKRVELDTNQNLTKKSIFEINLKIFCLSSHLSKLMYLRVATSEIGLDADFWSSRLARIVIFAISNLIKINLCIKTNPPPNN